MDDRNRTDRAMRYTLIIGLAITGLYTLWLPHFWSVHAMDVRVYWEAGARMLRGGVDLYAMPQDPANPVGPFIYPPLFAALIAPLTALPRQVGYAAWGLVQLGLLIASFWLLRCAVRVEAGEDARTFYVLAGLGVLPPVWMTLREGQVNLLVLTFLAGGLWFVEKRRDLSGGALLAAAAHLKVLPLVVLPLLIAQKRLRAATAMGGGIVLLTLVPLLYTVPIFGLQKGAVAGLRMNWKYAESVVEPRWKAGYAVDVGGARAPNHAIAAVVRRYFGQGHRLSPYGDERSPLVAGAPNWVLRISGLAVGAMLGGLAMSLAWRRRDSAEARVASVGLGVMAAGLASPLLWPHHLCLLLLLLAPLAAVDVAEENHRSVLGAGTALIVLVYLPMADTLAPFEEMAILGVPTLGILLVWVWVFVRFLLRPGAIDCVDEHPSRP